MQYGVIMAGGAGTRLWPVSRGDKPKQLINVTRGTLGAARMRFGRHPDGEAGAAAVVARVRL